MVVLRGQIKINCTNYGCVSLCSLVWLFKRLELRLRVPYGLWSIWGSAKGSRLSSRPLFCILKPIVLTSASLPFGLFWLTLRSDRLPAQAFSFQLKPFPSSCFSFQRLLKEQVLERGSFQGWACCTVLASHHHPRAQQWNLTPRASVDVRVSKTHIQRLPRNVPFPPFWRLVIIPSCLFFLTALSPLLFKLNSYCSKLNPFFLALSLLTNESNSSLCSWWLHFGYLWMRIISFSSLLS